MYSTMFLNRHPNQSEVDYINAVYGELGFRSFGGKIDCTKLY